MPTYTYRCIECGEQFDIVQRITDSPLRICPECKGELKKVINNVPFSLKGKGWYKDGY